MVALPNVRGIQDAGVVAVRSLTQQIKMLARLLQTLSEADARPTLWGALKDFVADYGYTRLTVLESNRDKEAAVLFSDANQQALDQFHQTSAQPLFAKVLSSTEPFSNPELEQQSPSAANPIALYPGESLFVPLPDGDSSKGVAVLAGESPDMSTTARSLIQVASEAAFDRAQSLLVGENTGVTGLLSPREAAILGWAAAGKTDAEIGSHLKISARTVRFHTDNAKRKLRVTTRIQAVTEALRLGLIKL